MQTSYNIPLVILSVVIAVQGSYVGLLLARTLADHTGLQWKIRLGAAAVSLAVSIWAMHFIGMLAIRLNLPVDYDVLLTVVSALIAMLAVGAALFFCTVIRPGRLSLGLGGAMMGGGISAMHYIGMSALAGVTCLYDPVMVAASVAVGMGSSMLGLRLLFVGGRGYALLTSALALGGAISGMHYTAMLAASFEPITTVVPFTAPALTNDMLAIIVAIIAFAISAIFFLTLLPDRVAVVRADVDGSWPDRAWMFDTSGKTPAALRIPVTKEGKTVLLAPDDIYAVRADAHYSTVFDGERTYFCALSISQIEVRMGRAGFVRVHRSHLVNLEHAAALSRRGEQGVLELDGETPYRVPVSRTRLKTLKTALGV
ncbi:NO-binding membrane sensor protein with MHYT domain [Breoghania corrubedonensis]|uniref:NO-binding membrane sensor protein with MHYT domain n=1 Tax=Breoghania corrubedonensis TaxID=665038 RepID=A0A2T5V1F1_9HYPH|nr:MHYT domain-containing protein [Breoghania corrubedonensis]PTW57591.1 NO-binding membrane sensor protein with MHYT domain [Breoghania corrubedonensis]